MKKIITLCIVLIWTIQSLAVIVTADGDPNTNAPAGDCGWHTQGKLISTPYGVTVTNPVTVIGTNYVLISSHVLVKTNDIINYGGTNYPVIATYPSNKLQMLKVSGKFPNGSWPKLNTNMNVFGQTFYMFGCSPQRGAVITTTNYPAFPLVLTNCSSCDSSNMFDVVGGDVGECFEVQWTTNLTSWYTFTNCMVPGNCNLRVAIAKGPEQFIAYRAVAIPTVRTNGWKVNTFSDGKIRWGKNQFGSDVGDNGLLWSTFDLNGSCGTNEAAIWSDDSSGGCFVNSGGEWKLTAIIEQTTLPWYRTQTGEKVKGVMCDQRGLDFGLDKNGTMFIPFPDSPNPEPARSEYVRLADYKGWLAQFAGK
jgi:hypothetical protein